MRPQTISELSNKGSATPGSYVHTRQCYRLQDNLVDVLLASVQAFHKGVLREHKERCYFRREQHLQVLRTLVGSLDTGVHALVTIQAITRDPGLTDAEKLARVGPHPGRSDSSAGDPPGCRRPHRTPGSPIPSSARGPRHTGTSHDGGGDTRAESGIVA